jgi:hypothetical protein
VALGGSFPFWPGPSASMMEICAFDYATAGSGDVAALKAYWSDAKARFGDAARGKGGPLGPEGWEAGCGPLLNERPHPFGVPHEAQVSPACLERRPVVAECTFDAGAGEWVVLRLCAVGVDRRSWSDCPLRAVGSEGVGVGVGVGASAGAESWSEPESEHETEPMIATVDQALALLFAERQRQQRQRQWQRQQRRLHQKQKKEGQGRGQGQGQGREREGRPGSGRTSLWFRAVGWDVEMRRVTLAYAVPRDMTSRAPGKFGWEAAPSPSQKGREGGHALRDLGVEGCWQGLVSSERPTAAPHSPSALRVVMSCSLGAQDTRRLAGDMMAHATRKRGQQDGEFIGEFELTGHALCYSGPRPGKAQPNFHSTIIQSVAAVVAPASLDELAALKLHQAAARESALLPQTGAQTQTQSQTQTQTQGQTQTLTHRQNQGQNKARTKAQEQSDALAPGVGPAVRPTMQDSRLRTTAEPKAPAQPCRPRSLAPTTNGKPNDRTGVKPNGKPDGKPDRRTKLANSTEAPLALSGSATHAKVGTVCVAATPKSEPKGKPKGEPNREPNGEPKVEPRGTPRGTAKGTPTGSSKTSSGGVSSVHGSAKPAVFVCVPKRPVGGRASRNVGGKDAVGLGSGSGSGSGFGSDKEQRPVASPGGPKLAAERTPVDMGDGGETSKADPSVKTDKPDTASLAPPEKTERAERTGRAGAPTNSIRPPGRQEVRRVPRAPQAPQAKGTLSTGKRDACEGPARKKLKVSDEPDEPSKSKCAAEPKNSSRPDTSKRPLLTAAAAGQTTGKRPRAR